MKFVLISTIIAITLASCGGSADPHAGHDHGGGGPEGSSVVLSPKQMSSLGLTLDSLHQRSIADAIRLTGFISVPPQNRADIASPAEGIVQNILVSEGEAVSKGQSLATISNPSFIQLQQDYLESRTQLSFSEMEYKRQQELNSGNVNSKKTLQEAEANYKTLLVRSNAHAKQLELLGINATSLSSENLTSSIVVKSPVSGTVSHISITLGTNVQFATTLMSVVDNSAAKLEILVFEKDISLIHSGQAVSFTLANTPDKIYAGQVSNIGSSFENETKAVKARAEITGGRSGLIDGMNANVILSGDGQLVDCVKDAAIVNYQGVDVIFVYSDAMQHDLLHSGHEHEAHSDEHAAEGEHAHEEEAHEDAEPEAGSIAFLKIAVKRGASAGGFTEIIPLQALPEDARIVVNGAFYVLAAITNQGEAHSH
ncbi:MAG: efflux RND transporter periplasmic adaptor subunit [Flavobacteriales bacterium]|nr:efflux RND transporter periplasmic adaptor subunit [Flavobacteriales bacterium]